MPNALAAPHRCGGSGLFGPGSEPVSITKPYGQLMGMGSIGVPIISLDIVIEIKKNKKNRKNKKEIDGKKSSFVVVVVIVLARQMVTLTDVNGHGDCHGDSDGDGDGGLDAEIWRSKPGSNQTGWQVKHQSCPKFLWANTQSLLILFVKGVDFYRHLYQFVLFVKSWPV